MTEAIKISFYVILLIFLGTITGGLAVAIVGKYFHKIYYYLNVFCGGILAGLLGFDLVPEVISSYNQIGILAGASIGIFFMLIIDRYLHHSKQVHFEHPETFSLLFLALLIHSIPSGLALGLNFQNAQFQDPSLLTVILIHHIPEGMVIMVSVLHSKLKLKTFLLLCLYLSFTVGLNTYLGISLNVDSIKFRTIFMGVAIGTLGYVTFYEILWKGLKKHLTFKMMIAALLGMVFLRLYLIIAAFSH